MFLNREIFVRKIISRIVINFLLLLFLERLKFRWVIKNDFLFKGIVGIEKI